MAKRQNKSARPSAEDAKGPARRALKRSLSLRAKAEGTHAAAEAAHARAEAAHRKVGALEKTARKRTGGSRVKDVPPPGGANERIEAAKRVGAPGTEALEIIE